MANLQDLINLAKQDGGKFFVLDENGEPKLVILGIEDYQKLLGEKPKKAVEDVDKVNREILKAQLTEPEIIKPVIQESKPSYPQSIERQQIPMVDLREEVIDPTFDFEGPKIDLDEI